MFDWLFKPKCPCDPAAKVWLEYRLRWLAREFPQSAFSGGPIITPTLRFFPETFDGSDGAVRRLMDRVCDYMDVNPRSIELRFEENANRLQLVNESGEALPDAAGTFQGGHRQHRITLKRSEFSNANDLIGTMAHELAHVRLLGEGRLDGSVFDNELLTDLTTVHFGLGLFLANSPRDWMSGYTHWPESRLRKPEYMNRPMYGWALALLAHFRDEPKPAWAQHLSRYARLELDQGIRYLTKTRDSSYLPREGQLLN